jgi:hypothetical protein
VTPPISYEELVKMTGIRFYLMEAFCNQSKTAVVKYYSAIRMSDWRHPLGIA